MKTKVIINGWTGKMGTALLACAETHPNLEIIGKVSSANESTYNIDSADVIVDFSTPDASCRLAAICRLKKKALVIGTTGHTQLDMIIINGCAEIVPVVMASNFSMGVNILFWLSRFVTQRVSSSVDIEILEIHHRRKKDAPSGTALTLAKIIAEVRSEELDDVVRFGRTGMVGPRKPEEIGIHSIRGGDVVGDHTVVFADIGERLELTHKASSRDTFANGALRAAAWVVGKKPGIYNMQDVLGLSEINI